MEAAIKRLADGGIEILTRHNHAIVEALEPDIADAFNLSMRIIDWEMRWFVRTLADRDIDKLSPPIRERMERAEAMTRAEYIDAMAAREAIREAHTELAADCEGYITLTGPDAAPVGLQSTGNPQLTVPASLLGVPAVTLPLLKVDGLPLGFQFVGFADRDADAFAACAHICNVLAQSAKGVPA
jgi:Asp-tRNA(Asn)/Glu-tRNA(Gln) amidotransferase A subunit family amidase